MLNVARSKFILRPVNVFLPLKAAQIMDFVPDYPPLLRCLITTRLPFDLYKSGVKRGIELCRFANQPVVFGGP